MSRRFVILIFLWVLSGCESPKSAQTATGSQQGEKPKIVPLITAAPARTPDIANSLSPVITDYDTALIKAVQNKWEKLLKNSEYRINQKSGQVTVKFKLHPDGSISELAVAQSTLGADLDKLSQAALAESAPFDPWPDEMKAKVVGNFRELTFTFRYY